MIVEQGWLEEFVNLNGWSAERVATVLTDLGLEVEHVHEPARVFNRFVVGKVLQCEKHPKADKLSVCSVDVGEEVPRTIVCGAPNVSTGQTVIAALDGALVPNGGYTIEKRTLRGVESNGMLCSAAELLLADEAEGIMVLDTEALPGTPAHVVLNLNTVYDVAITPNRTDCNSHIGIARDLRAYQQVNNEQHPVNGTSVFDGIQQTSTDAIPVHIDDAALTPIYALQRITGISNGPSPTWMQQRLRAIGLRPRNLVIDVTNYVNMEMGQPLHAFDTTKLSGPAINVRVAANETEFVTLDDKTRTLTEGMLLICDAAQPIAIAGVMGGANSEIHDNTTDVCLESAWFSPQSIRRTARTLGLSTDASYRFERGIDPGGVVSALDRATSLLTTLGGGTAHSRTVTGNLPQQPAITVRYQRMRAINGIEVSDATIVAMLTAIGCSVTEAQEDCCIVTPPSWRQDIQAEIDLAEEVMRLYGVNAIPEKATAATQLNGSNLAAHLRSAGGREGLLQRTAIRSALTARGYATVIGSVLTAPSQNPEIQSTRINLKNALGLEFSTLRSSLVPGMLHMVAHNLNHGAGTIRLAEFGSVFSTNAATELGVLQEEHLVLMISGQTEEHWSDARRSLDYYDVLGDLRAALHSNLHVAPNATPQWYVNHNSATLLIDQTNVGYIGEVSRDVAQNHGVDIPVYVAQVSLDALQTVSHQQSVYKPVSPFPTVRRDLALILDEKVSAAELHFVVEQVNAPAYLGAFIFDVFRDEKHIGVGRKSIGLALKFGAADRTLVDTDVEASVHSIVSAVQQRLGATMRGTA